MKETHMTRMILELIALVSFGVMVCLFAIVVR